MEPEYPDDRQDLVDHLCLTKPLEILTDDTLYDLSVDIKPKPREVNLDQYGKLLNWPCQTCNENVTKRYNVFYIKIPDYKMTIIEYRTINGPEIIYKPIKCNGAIDNIDCLCARSLIHLAKMVARKYGVNPNDGVIFLGATSNLASYHIYQDTDKKWFINVRNDNGVINYQYNDSDIHEELKCIEK